MRLEKCQLARGEAIGFPLILSIRIDGFRDVSSRQSLPPPSGSHVFPHRFGHYGLSRSFEESVYVQNMASDDRHRRRGRRPIFIVSRFPPGFTRGGRHGAGKRAERERPERPSCSAPYRRLCRSPALCESDGSRAPLDGVGRDRRRVHLVCFCSDERKRRNANASGGRTFIDRLAAATPLADSESARDAFWKAVPVRFMRLPRHRLAERGIMRGSRFLLLDAYVHRRARRAAETAGVLVATLRVHAPYLPGFARPCTC